MAAARPAAGYGLLMYSTMKEAMICGLSFVGGGGSQPYIYCCVIVKLKFEAERD